MEDLQITNRGIDGARIDFRGSSTEIHTLEDVRTFMGNEQDIGDKNAKRIGLLVAWIAVQGMTHTGMTPTRSNIMRTLDGCDFLFSEPDIMEAFSEGLEEGVNAARSEGFQEAVWKMLAP